MFFQEIKSTNDLFFCASATINCEKIGIIEDYLIYHRRNNINSISNTREKNYTCAIDALNLLYHYLKNNSLYERFEIDFLSYVLNLMQWQIDTLKFKEGKRLYNILKLDIFLKYDFDKLKKCNGFFDKNNKKFFEYVKSKTYYEYIIFRTKDIIQEKSILDFFSLLIYKKILPHCPNLIKIMLKK